MTLISPPTASRRRARTCLALPLACLTGASAACVGPDSASEDDLGAVESAVSTSAVPFNGRAMYFGTLAFVTCNSSESCPASATMPGAIDCRTTMTKRNGTSRYWKPLFFCDYDCPTALARAYSDSARLITMPDTSSGVLCGQQLTVCWNGACVDGEVRDKHYYQANQAYDWELNKGIMDALRAPYGTLASGVRITAGPPTAAPTKIAPGPATSVGATTALTWQPVYPGTTSYQVTTHRYEGSSWRTHGTYGTQATSLPFYPYVGYWYKWSVAACNSRGCGPRSAETTFIARP